VEVILAREVAVPTAAGATISVRFEVGPVEQVDTDEWECACAVAVGTKQVRLRVTGMDSLQATVLAVRLVRREANSLLDRSPLVPTRSFGSTLLLVRRRRDRTRDARR
jgi:hypothetical protein